MTSEPTLSLPASVQAGIAAAQQATLATLLQRAENAYSTLTALKFEDRTWTYAQLGQAVHRVAHRLAESGLQRGERVAAYGANSDAYLILFLACAEAGLVHVPVNFALQGQELAHLLEDSGAALVISDPELADTLNAVLASGRATQVRAHWSLTPAEGEGQAPSSGTPSILETARDEGQASSPLQTQPASEDLVQLLYTSGTTSAPKGAMMTHRALMSQYSSALIALAHDGQDRPLICMPLYHSAALHVFALPYLTLGATIRLLRRPDIEQILDLVGRERIGSLFLAPTVWVPLAGHPALEDSDLSSLRKAQYGASIMPVTVLAKLQRRYPEIGFYNCFGQSELGPLCTVLRPEEHTARPSSCGRPVALVQPRVVDPEGRPVALGEPGEIQYRSPQLMDGYWNQPEATEAAFMDGWFRSGDQVVQDQHGFIQVVDRIKDVINTGGVMVAPREVEDCIYQIEGVAEVAVIGLPDERWIEAITAVVVLRDGVQVTAETVREHVRGRLAAFKVPKRVEFVAELPRNQSGKLLKRELRQERTQGAQAPTTTTTGD